MNQLLHRFTGQADQLLAYHEISDKLEITETIKHGLQEIPLDAIVGSVGRSEDFTRDYLPKRDSDAERWARVKSSVMEMKGWSPIDVYKLGDAYFVIDGNHRVSVARRLGNKRISAHVTEVRTQLPLDGDTHPAGIVCRVNYVRFLLTTGLGISRPEADLSLTFTDQYALLLRQIESCQQCLASQSDQAVALQEAAAYWYDQEYLPTVKLIRSQGTVRNFEDRTEADIFVMLSEKREELEQGLGWDISPRSAIAILPPKRKIPLGKRFFRVGGKILDLVMPDLEKGPPPGQWRRQIGASPRDRALFADILVSLQGTNADWHLLDETIYVAGKENGRILAIHAVDSEAGLQSDETKKIGQIFSQRCAAAGIEGQFAVEVGVEGNLMIERAAWVDLMATNLTFATEQTPRPGLSSGVDGLIKRCPRPVLVLAGEQHSAMDRALLAYDGSPKSDEALFVATYLALRWQIALAVVTVRTKHTPPTALERARLYLTGHHLTKVEYILQERPIAKAIMTTAVDLDCNLLIIGGYGIRKMRHMTLGSTVTDALQAPQQPILICR